MKTIRIMSYNIGWLQGEGSEGVNFKKKSLLHFKSGMSSVARTIIDNKIDLACLQEIDFDADKSHNIDQFQELKNKTNYFGEKLISWNIPYLPFPYFNHWKKVVSGGAILSRKKIKAISQHLFDAPTNMFFLKRLFYLKRYIQIIKIKFKGKNEYVFNLHLEAFDFNAKQEQLIFLQTLIKEFQPIAVCGDFNTLPQGQNKKLEIDYSNDYAIDLLPKIMSEYKDIFGNFLTFPTKKENCRLDYIWVRNDLNAKIIDLNIVFNPSDHVPIALEIF